MTPRPDTDPAIIELPLIGPQPGIWLADQIAGRAGAWAVAHYVELNGELDADRLVCAIRHGVAEADTLHARYAETETGPVQRIPLHRSPEEMDEPERLDLRGEPDPAEAARRWMEADLAQPLTADGDLPLARQALLRVGETRWFWYQRLHHLMVDGYGFTALTKRIAECYTALGRGDPPGDTPFVSFAKVVEEYQAYEHAEAHHTDREFWAQHARDLPAAPTLALAPGDEETARPIRHRTLLAPWVAEALTGLGRANRATLAESAMTAVALYLQRITGLPRLTVGLPFMRRIGSVAIRAGSTP